MTPEPTSLHPTSLHPTSLGAITLFVDDLAATRPFYADVLGLRPVFSDDVSAAFDLGGTVVNLLHVSAAPELVTPAPVGGAGTPVRVQLTLEVEDTDAVCAQLAELGVPLLNGPVDRPWGLRTAAFADPSGHVWEVAASIRAD